MNSVLQLAERVERLAEKPVVKSSLSHAIRIESLSRRLPEILHAAKPAKYNAVKKHHDKVRDAAEAIYQGALNRVLAETKAEVLKNIVARPTASGQGVVSGRRAGETGVFLHPATPAAAGNVVRADETTPTEASFSLKSFARRFASAMSGAAETAYKVCARGLLTDLDLEDRVTDQGIISEFSFNRENKLKDCPQEIFDQVQKSLEEGDAAGETMDELRDRVQDEFDGISKGRAFVIARTESQSAYGTAQMNVLQAEGYELKVWQTSDDELVRESHAECEEEGAIDIDEDFSNGLAFPGDPDCDDASEIVGCRCYLIKGEPDDEGTEEDDE